MRILVSTFIILTTLSCSSPKSESELTADSTISTAAEGPTEAQLAEERAHLKYLKEQHDADSVHSWTMDMAYNPLTVSTVDSLKLLLATLSIPYTSPYGSFHTFAFDSSFVSIKVYEANEGGGEAVCKADIMKNGFPLKNGLKIGMMKPELFNITHWKEEDFSHASMDPPGLKSINLEINPSGDPYILAIYIDATKLAGIHFIAGCGMNP